MTRYLVIHKTPAEITQEELISTAREQVAALPPDVRWLNSWLAGEAETLFCEWEADDKESLLAVLGPTQELFPVETVHLVTWVDPDWYK